LVNIFYVNCYTSTITNQKTERTYPSDFKTSELQNNKGIFNKTLKCAHSNIIYAVFNIINIHTTESYILISGTIDYNIMVCIFNLYEQTAIKKSTRRNLSMGIRVNCETLFMLWFADDIQWR